jgi:hypothetical protein
MGQALHDMQPAASSRMQLSNELGVMRLEDSLAIETDRFEHRDVKPNFINPCCFGEDFAAWLSVELSALIGVGFHFSEPIQEDYGWGLWAHHGADPFWIALSYVGDGPTEGPAQWVLSVAYDPGLNLVKRMFHRPNVVAFSTLRDHIWRTINRASDIKLIEGIV